MKYRLREINTSPALDLVLVEVLSISEGRRRNLRHITYYPDSPLTCELIWWGTKVNIAGYWQERQTALKLHAEPARPARITTDQDSTIVEAVLGSAVIKCLRMLLRIA